MNRFGLLGEKLKHSFSPIIHNYIYKRLNMDATYELIESDIDGIKNVIDKVKSGYYKGINVTIPYKKEVMKYLDEIDPKALKIGACNTVTLENGKLKGYNTDYYGFMDELNYYNINPNKGKCYILGNGGASKAIISYFDDIKADYEIVARQSHGYEFITFEEFEKRNDQFLIVNATPVGMYPNVSDIPISIEACKKAKYGVDLIYNPLETCFVKNVKNGYNGLYMLVAQAIKSFEIWNNIKVDFKDDIYNYVLEVI